MDALVAAGAEAARGAPVVRVAIVPTAVARHRPELAVAHADRAFRAAADRARVTAEVTAVSLLRREDGADAAAVATLEAAHVVHLPGGDPDLLPEVLRATLAWAAILRALEGGSCLAGASAGAMALAERLWTPDGPMEGLGLVSGIAVLPHYAGSRLDGWRRVVDPERRLAWLGLEEQTLVLGRPGERWRVAGRGRAFLIHADAAQATESAGPGEMLDLPA